MGLIVLVLEYLVDVTDGDGWKEDIGERSVESVDRIDDRGSAVLPGRLVHQKRGAGKGYHNNHGPKDLPSFLVALVDVDPSMQTASLTEFSEFSHFDVLVSSQIAFFTVFSWKKGALLSTACQWKQMNESVCLYS
jgi:hypothetical protein